jgi:ABC-type multidrug transport system ATPase subunit
VSVALELLTAPRLLILDEPTSGLDPGLEATMMGLFADVAATGRMVLVATHAMESLNRCHALLLLMAGQIVYFGPPEQAPAHFGVDRYASIFSRLSEQPPAAWGRVWAESPIKRAFLNRPQPVLSAPGTATTEAA